MDMIEHRVRERAYYIWEGKGRVIGRAEAHLLQAEAEFAALSDAVVPAAVNVSEAATKAPAGAKAAAPKAAAKAPAKAAAPKAAAPKAAAAKVAAKPRKTPRAEAGIALH